MANHTTQTMRTYKNGCRCFTSFVDGTVCSNYSYGHGYNSIHRCKSLLLWHVGLGEKKSVGCVTRITGYLYKKIPRIKLPLYLLYSYNACYSS